MTLFEDPLVVFALQAGLSTIVFALLATWVLGPRLAALPREKALVPLLWVHVFRYVPMTLLAPGQIDPAFPLSAAAPIALGDLLAALLAMVALVALRVRARLALPIVWAFSVVSVLDMISAGVHGASVEVYRHALGVNWYVVTFYVPALFVTQVMIVARLLERRRHGVAVAALVSGAGTG